MIITFLKISLLFLSILIANDNSIFDVYFSDLSKSGDINSGALNALNTKLKNQIKSIENYRLVAGSTKLKESLNKYNVVNEKCFDECFTELQNNFKIDLLIIGSIRRSGYNYHLSLSLVNVIESDIKNYNVSSNQGVSYLIEKIKFDIADYMIDVKNRFIESSEQINEKNYVNISENINSKKDYYNTKCNDREVELWGKCYSIEETDTLEIDGYRIEKKLKGEIPNKIGNLINLKYLNISGNNLSGNLPKSIKNLKKIQSIDLSNNNLYGEFVNILDNLPLLIDVNISGNLYHSLMPIFLPFNDSNEYPKVVRLDKMSNVMDTSFYINYDRSVIDKAYVDNYWTTKDSKLNKYDVLDGIFIEYYPNNDKRTEIIIDMGIINNINQWDEKGDLIVQNGNGFFKGYIPGARIFFEGKIDNNLMVGDWKFFGMNNNLIAVVEYDNYPGFSDWWDYESFSLYFDKGKIKKLFFFNGEKHYEIVNNEQTYYFQDGSIFQKCSNIGNRDGTCISYSIINLFSDQKLFFAEDIKYKSEFISEYRIVDDQWELVKCYNNEKECENFIYKDDSEVDTWYRDYHIGYCECE